MVNSLEACVMIDEVSNPLPFEEDAFLMKASFVVVLVAAAVAVVDIAE